MLTGFKLEEGVVSIAFFVLAIAWIFSDPGFIPGWIEWFPEPGFIKDGVPAMLIGIILFIIPGLFSEETNSYKVSSFKIDLYVLWHKIRILSFLAKNCQLVVNDSGEDC